MRNKVEQVEIKALNQRNKFFRINEFIDNLEEHDELITEFDEELWNNSINKVCVYSRKK